MTGSRSTSDSSRAARSCSGASAKTVRRLPSGVFGPEHVAHGADLIADLAPLLALGGEDRVDAFQLRAQLLVLGADLEFLQLAQTAQPHVEDRFGLHIGELERLHQLRLRLILVRMILNHLVDVEIRDQVTAEHFEPMLDLRLAMAGAAQQHVSEMIEPFAQRLGEAEHLGNAALHQHVEVQRNLALELGELEQRFHHQLGIDGARLRLDDDANVFGGFVADVADQRQFLVV